jgi:arylsulfatase A-like enzyme
VGREGTRGSRARGSAAPLQALVAGLALAAACSRSSDPRTAPSVSLVAAVERGKVDGGALIAIECAELRELGGDLSAAHPELVLLRDPLGAASAGWMEGAEIADASKRARSLVEDPLERRRVLHVPGGAGGLHRVVAVSTPDALVVQARVRAVAPGERPALSVLTVDAAPAEDPRRALLELHRSRVRTTDGRRSLDAEATVEAPEDAGETWRTLALFLPPDPSRRGLRLSLAEGSGLLVDEVVVRRAARCEAIGAARRELGDESGPSVVAWVRGATRQSRSLVLPAGSKVRLALDVPAASPRLEATLGAHPLAPGSRVRLALRIGGETIAEQECAGDDATRFAVALDRFAGRRVELELAAEGSEGSVAALGDPWLLSGSTRRPGPNLLLISIDTLRRDALRCYGNEAARTPAIDSLAAEGACFTQATSPASFTLPAHASLFSGQHPLVHGTFNPRHVLDPRRSALLAERLAKAGWQTAAFTAGVMLDPDFGFAHGFGSYSFRDVAGVDAAFQEKCAPLAPDGARFAGLASLVEWVDRRVDQPFFLFLHTYFVHNYVPSRDFAERHGARWRPDVVRGEDGAPPMEFLERIAQLERDPRNAEDLRRLYQATVEEVDARLVAPLLAELDRLHLADRTIVALVSDHGEEFQEHGHLLHGRFLWRELVDVPLILRGPGVPVVRRDDPVELEDVAPTLAARLGLPPDERVLGRDLFATDAGEGEAARLLHLANGQPVIRWRWDGLRLGRFTILREHLEGGRMRDLLFDSATDPGETSDLAAERPDDCARLGRRLDEEVRRTVERAARLPGGAGEREGGDPELEKRMKELGYTVR